MKKEEFMLDDYIQYPKGKIMKIKTLDKYNNRVYVNDEDISLNYLPIGITSDILEKNEFKHMVYNIYRFDNGYQFVTYDFDSNKLNILTPSFNFNGIVFFVNELQNFMRLCHIDKEIEL